MTKIADTFLHDVARHKLMVLQDDDLRRHLRFKTPGTSENYFDLITWDGHLCYTGDMGTYVFNRMPDMLDFFRNAVITPGYWAEKVIAQDGDGITKYSEEKFIWLVRRWMDTYDFSPEAREQVEREIIPRAELGEQVARQSIADFTPDSDECGFTDFQEENLHEYTPRYLWCCHALVWAVEQYDLLAQPSPTLS